MAFFDIRGAKKPHEVSSLAEIPEVKSIRELESSIAVTRVDVALVQQAVAGVCDGYSCADQETVAQVLLQTGARESGKASAATLKILQEQWEQTHSVAEANYDGVFKTCNEAGCEYFFWDNTTNNKCGMLQKGATEQPSLRLSDFEIYWLANALGLNVTQDACKTTDREGGLNIARFHLDRNDIDPHLFKAGPYISEMRKFYQEHPAGISKPRLREFESALEDMKPPNHWPELIAAFVAVGIIVHQFTKDRKPPANPPVNPPPPPPAPPAAAPEHAPRSNRGIMTEELADGLTVGLIASATLFAAVETVKTVATFGFVLVFGN